MSSMFDGAMPLRDLQTKTQSLLLLLFLLLLHSWVIDCRCPLGLIIQFTVFCTCSTRDSHFIFLRLTVLGFSGDILSPA